MNDKSLVLFDMDGTLTPVRKKMEPDMVEAINVLTSHTRVGIITGSKYAYVVDQIPQLFNGDLKSRNMIDIMPCNGTKIYKYVDDEYRLTAEVNMVEKIGRSSYNSLIKECNFRQGQIMEKFELPYTGTFIQYRGSLLNWCPIGRDAADYERSEFIKVDEESSLRLKYKDLIQVCAAIKGIDITVALGGSTSLDIYPNGWDKTYGLKHYPDHEAYFVGDKCQPGGNDWHLYDKLKSSGRSYETKNCSNTIQIINDIVSIISKSSVS